MVTALPVFVTFFTQQKTRPSQRTRSVGYPPQNGKLKLGKPKLRRPGKAKRTKPMPRAGAAT